MKTFAATFVILLAMVSTAVADRPVPKGWHGQWKGRSYFVYPNDGGHLGERWSPAKGEAPLSSARAVGVARRSLARLVGSVEAKFLCREVILRGIEPEYDYWFYVVTFTHEEAIDGKSKRDAVLPFVVYFDGFVVAPWLQPDPL